MQIGCFHIYKKLFQSCNKSHPAVQIWCGKRDTYFSPYRERGVILKPSDFQKTIQCQFDCKLKKVVKGIVRNYRKELARRQAKEVSFCELPEIVVEKLIVWDDYESEYTIFDVCGTEIHVLDEELAEATLKVSDTPKVTDTLIELFKIDMETQKDNPQGNASLAGAEFTWKYYAGFYTKDNLPAEVTRTWVTKTIAETDSDGTTHYITKLADAYKVSGDSFYMQDGKAVLPLGTLTVEKTKAPNGYLLDGAYMQAGDKSEQIKGLYLTQITEDGDLAVLSGSNQFSVRDVFLQNEDGTPSTQIKKRIYDLKCSLHGGIIPVSVSLEVPLREFSYNVVVELVNPVADTVSRKTYTGADVDWYVKAEDIVLKNKGNQNAGSPQSPTPQGQPKK